MRERNLGETTREVASALGRTLGRAARGGRQHLEVFLGGPDRTRVIFLLAAVLALASADAATVGASAIELRQALHINNFDIGLLIAVTSIVAAVASIPFGVLADRGPRTSAPGRSHLPEPPRTGRRRGRVLNPPEAASEAAPEETDAQRLARAQGIVPTTAWSPPIPPGWDSSMRPATC